MTSDSRLHTPTPWSVSQSGADDYRILGPNPNAGKEHVSYSGDLFQVATTDSPEEAAFIVRAVNAHDALVAALEEVALFLPAGDTIIPSAITIPNMTIAAVRAAIAAAEGDAS